jgi:hypothetical protein
MATDTAALGKPEDLSPDLPTPATAPALDPTRSAGGRGRLSEASFTPGQEPVPGGRSWRRPPCRPVCHDPPYLNGQELRDPVGDVRPLKATADGWVARCWPRSEMSARS